MMNSRRLAVRILSLLTFFTITLLPLHDARAQSFTFLLEVEDTMTGFFTEVSGIGSEHEITEQSVVATNGVQIVRKLPGRLKWNDITLKRGITANMDIWAWRKVVEDGGVIGARKNGTITMLDQAGTPIARWNFENAWPSKVTGPSPKSDSNEFGVEELTMVIEYLERIAP